MAITSAVPTLKRLAGKRVVASISGGKDSAAMSLYLSELGIEHDRVFMDTGWEHPLTYEYIAGPLAAAIGSILTIKPPLGMADLCRKKGMFPSRTRRFCTSELKVKPIINHITRLQDAGYEVINAVGVRKAESAVRSKLTEWEWQPDYDSEVWRPLIEWTEADVISIHTRHSLKPNPLYLLGASRVGCWPCIFARKSELRFIADVDPARIDLIRALEADVQSGCERRHTARGTTIESEGHLRPSFFQAMGALRSEGQNGRMVPIDEVVRWSRTAHGGRQFELFAPVTEEGCVRWGLCDVAKEAQ